MFGSAWGEEEEAAVAISGPSDVRVHPLSAFRKYWEIVTILLVIYTVLVLPFRYLVPSLLPLPPPFPPEPNLLGSLAIWR